MAGEYRDRWIACTPEAIEVRGYYFPWGTKRIPYGSIRSLRRVEIGAPRGRARIWGTSNPGYWASLDPHRRRKTVGLILDLGRRVRPFITPDDPRRGAERDPEPHGRRARRRRRPVRAVHLTGQLAAGRYCRAAEAGRGPVNGAAA